MVVVKGTSTSRPNQKFSQTKPFVFPLKEDYIQRFKMFLAPWNRRGFVIVSSKHQERGELAGLCEIFGSILGMKVAPCNLATRWQESSNITWKWLTTPPSGHQRESQTKQEELTKFWWKAFFICGSSQVYPYVDNDVSKYNSDLDCFHTSPYLRTLLRKTTFIRKKNLRLFTET